MGTEITKNAETTMTTAAAPADFAKIVESIVTRGDLSGLTPAQRTSYYLRTCERLGVDAHTQPFSFLTLNGKQVMYAGRGCTDQLARIHNVNRKIIDGPKVIDLAGTKMVIAVCEASMPNGRIDTSTATVPLVDPVNVMMKCETKAKRRATLSILGLGMLDEVELETIPAKSQGPAPDVDFGHLRGEITADPAPPVEAPPADDEQPAEAPVPAALESFYALVSEIELPGEAVAVWLKFRAELAPLSATDREAAWKRLCARTEEVGKMKNCKVWLKKAIAEEDARRGNVDTRPPAPVTTPDPSKPVADVRPVSPELAGLVADVAGAQSQAAVVSAWMRHRAGLVDAEHARGWICAVKRVAELLNVPEKRADEVLLEGVQECENDPGPPDGGAPAQGEGGASSTGTKARSGGKAKAPAAAAQASARPVWLDDEIAFRTHVGEELTDVFHLSGSARKWGKLFNSAQRWLYALRYQQLRREMSPASLPPSVADCDIAVRTWIAEGPQPSKRRAAA